MTLRSVLLNTIPKGIYSCCFAGWRLPYATEPNWQFINLALMKYDSVTDLRVKL